MRMSGLSRSIQDQNTMFPLQLDENERISPRGELSADQFRDRLEAWAQGFADVTGLLPEEVKEAQHRIEACRVMRATELDLSGLSLTSLPDVISHLGHLETLRASNNQLDKFPGWLGSLKSLRTLDLSFNRIRSNSHDFMVSNSIERVSLHDNPELQQFPRLLAELMHNQDVEVQCHNTGISDSEQELALLWIGGEHPESADARPPRAMANALRWSPDPALPASQPINIPGRSASHDCLSGSDTACLFKSAHEVLLSSVQEKMLSRSSSAYFDPKEQRRHFSAI